MIPLLLSGTAALGTFWLYTATAMGWRGLRLGPRVTDVETRRPRFEVWLAQAGIEDLAAREFIAVVFSLSAVGWIAGFALFGGPLPATVVGFLAASLPIDSYRRRRLVRRQRAQEAWPRMIEEIRVQTGALGRSVPQALFEVGRRGPTDLRPAFAAAHQEWLLTTDLPRTLRVLKDRLTDPTADMACETLLIAHELGGSDLDRRLEALAEDRRQDVQGRKDARSRQAGARFARLFVLLVPAGMAAAGMSIGNGRAAYRTGGGQLTVVVALVLVICCWVWAGAVMRLPEQQRVFQR